MTIFMRSRLLFSPLCDVMNEVVDKKMETDTLGGFSE